MKVALLGAPGSGKSKIAKRLARRLNSDEQKWTVVDGYVDRLRNRTHWDFGPSSDLRGNLQVLAERWTLEDEAAAKGRHTISCGSLYETVIYTAIPSLSIPTLGDESLMLEATRIAQITMELMGILERQTFDYDALLYLPLGQESHSWDDVIDAKLGEALEGFFRMAVILDGTDKQKVEHAEALIRQIYTTLYQDHGEGVRSHSPDGEVDGDGSDGVSDVQAEKD